MISRSVQVPFLFVLSSECNVGFDMWQPMTIIYMIQVLNDFSQFQLQLIVCFFKTSSMQQPLLQVFQRLCYKLVVFLFNPLYCLYSNIQFHDSLSYFIKILSHFLFHLHFFNLFIFLPTQSNYSTRSTSSSSYLILIYQMEYPLP